MFLRRGCVEESQGRCAWCDGWNGAERRAGRHTMGGGGKRGKARVHYQPGLRGKTVRAAVAARMRRRARENGAFALRARERLARHLAAAVGGTQVA